MSNGVTIENLMQTLPSVLANDSGMKPLGETASMALADMWRNVNLPTIFSRIDELPESLLDILAKDLKVDWYNYDSSIETKRSVIKNNFYVHKHLGTVGAVRRALAGLFTDSRLFEPWEYGGQPYHFRIVVNGPWSEERQTWALQAIEKSKNVRSWLDNITFHLPELSDRKELFVGIALYGSSAQTMDRTELPDLSGNYLEDGWGNILLDGFGVALTTD